MFDILFGWRKASKCKKLIKLVQCRLKLLRNKRFVIVRQLKEDIAQLLKDGHESIAFNRLQQLYMDESILSVYEMLDHFSEFIILNLSYIRRHKDIPNDINEAVSTLIFTSARCGDLPELRLVRKLFGERYGQKFVTTAVELHPGDLVNQQVKENLTPGPASEEVKNKLLDEIVRDYFFKPGPLALKYKPEFHAQQEKVIGFVEDDIAKESSTSTNCSIVLQPSPSIFGTPTGQIVVYKADAIEERTHKDRIRNNSCSSQSSTEHPELSVVYLDDVQEFESPTKQDQRFFLFNSSLMCKTERSAEDTKTSTRKRMRRRSVSREKHTINDTCCEVYYNHRRSDHQNKCRKKIQIDEKVQIHRCSLDQPRDSHTNDGNRYENMMEYHVCREEIAGMGLSTPNILTPARRSGPPPPYVRAVTMPQRREKENPRMEITRSSSLPPPRFVHPKLPAYDEIAAKFMELKKVYQQNKCKS